MERILGSVLYFKHSDFVINNVKNGQVLRIPSYFSLGVIVGVLMLGLGSVSYCGFFLGLGLPDRLGSRNEGALINTQCPRLTTHHQNPHHRRLNHQNCHNHPHHFHEYPMIIMIIIIQPWHQNLDHH